jgi:hypothetical protein
MATERDLALENRQVYKWIRDSGHQEYVAQAISCDRFVQGLQWSPEALANLGARRKPHLTINKLLATYAALAAEQVSRGGDVSFRTSAGGDPKTAATIDKLWLNFSYDQNREHLESLMFKDGVIRSRGFMDLRINFDESMRGEPVLSYLNSKDVGLYPGDNGHDPDDWTGLLISRWLTARDITEIYGKHLNDVLLYADTPELDCDYVDWRKDSFGTLMHESMMISPDQRAKYRLLRVLERQEYEYKNVQCFVDQPTGEVREVPQTWDYDRISEAVAQFGYGVIRRRVKKINWIVTVGDMLLHHSISPYRHFTPIPYFPFIIGGKPVGIVEQLRDPQNLLNKTLSQELHIVAGIANSGFKVQEGALANMTPEQLQERGSEDGIVIVVNGELNKVDKLIPNQVPSGLDRLHYTAGEVMQQISLVNDSMQGMNRADESGKAIERKSAQGSSALAPIFASLDQSRRILARNWLDLTQQFVTEERVYHITNRAKTAQTEQVQVNQEQWDGSFLNDLTVGEYMIQVTDVRSRDSYDQNQFDIMMQMIREGAPIPWSEVVNSLTILENRDEIVQFLKQQEGQVDPSEEDKKKKELEIRLMEADASDKESSAAVKNAQAQKHTTETQKTAQGDTKELDKINAEAYTKQQEMELKGRQDEQKAALEREKMQAEMQIAREKAQMDAELARAKLQFEKEKQQMELQFQREKNQMELAKLRATMDLQQQQAGMQMETTRQQTAAKQEQTDMQMQAKQQEIQMDMENSRQQSELDFASSQRDAELKHDTARQRSEMKNKQGEQSLKLAAQHAALKPKSKTGDSK